MVSVLVSMAVDPRFDPWSGQTKVYTVCIYGFSAKPAALKSKSKDWLAVNQENVSERSDMSIASCCFSELALKIYLIVLFLYKVDLITISLKSNFVLAMI
jgi:hypothetical protein